MGKECLPCGESLGGLPLGGIRPGTTVVRIGARPARAEESPQCAAPVGQKTSSGSRAEKRSLPGPSALLPSDVQSDGRDGLVAELWSETVRSRARVCMFVMASNGCV